MNPKLAHLTLLLALVLGPTGTGLLARHKRELNGFGEFVDSTRSEWHVPGMAVGIVRDGKVIFAQAFGHRDLAGRLPVTTRTVFPIGSATKSFTAMAVAILVDDDLLRMDEPLHMLLPGLRLHDEYTTSHVTARDLLCHRSGLAGQYELLWLTTRVDRRELFRRLRYFRPGAGFREQFQYSNIGYAIAGILAEQLSGMTWEEFQTDRIFQPLGMKRTSFVSSESPSFADEALPYRLVGDELTAIPYPGSVVFDNVQVIGPAGSIKSCVEDMTNWLLLHLNGGVFENERIVSSRTLSEMHSPQVAVRNPGYTMIMQSEIYGLGWAVSDYRGHRVVNHGGNIEGYSALVSLMPDIKTGVVVLTNSMNLLGYVLSRNVYDRFLGLEPRDWNTDLRALYSQIEQAYGSGAATDEIDVPSDGHATFGAYTGAYANPVFGRVEITAPEGKLVFQFESGVKATLRHVQEHQFRGRTAEFYLPVIETEFHPDNDGVARSLSLVLQPGSDGVLFERTPNVGAEARTE